MSLLESTVRTVKRGLGLTSHSPLVEAVRPAYDLLLGTIYGRGLKRRIHSEPPIRVKPRYRWIPEDYEPAVFTALKSRVHSGSVVLDIGANVGVFSLLMARWVGSAGRVYAFEPAPESLWALRRHVALNELAEKIEVVGQAVSDVTGEAMFFAHTFNEGNSLSRGFLNRVPAAQAVRVPVTTVDCFCGQRDIIPTLLKIDIEGFELHALRGAKQTLARHRPAVVVELHPMNWPEIGESPETAAALLAELGYRATPLEGQADPLAEYGHVVLEPSV